VLFLSIQKKGDVQIMPLLTLDNVKQLTTFEALETSLAAVEAQEAQLLAQLDQQQERRGELSLVLDRLSQLGQVKKKRES
jgi:hypothetical protein